MVDSRSIYLGQDFAEAWYNQQVSREDVLRTRMMNSILLKGIGDLSECTVLDAGCGHGFFLDCLLERTPRSLCAFDISSFLVKVAFSNYPSVIMCVADLADRLPYRSNIFDVVVCYNVLMELPDIGQAMSEISRVTRLDGSVHIVIVHPLYNLFINDRRARTEPPVDRLKRYMWAEQIRVTTISGFDDFVVHRRPISHYVNAFSEVGLSLERMIEVPISEDLAEVSPSLGRRVNVPVFIGMVHNRLTL
jgi:SAM-dependent methyltransferase